MNYEKRISNDCNCMNYKSDKYEVNHGIVDCDNLVINTYMDILDVINYIREKAHSNIGVFNKKDSALDLQSRVTSSMDTAINQLMVISASNDSCCSNMTQAIELLLKAYSCCSYKKKENHNQFNNYNQSEILNNCDQYIKIAKSNKIVLDKLVARQDALALKAGDAIQKLVNEEVNANSKMFDSLIAYQKSADLEHEANTLLIDAFQLRAQSYLCIKQGKQVTNYNECNNLKCCNEYRIESDDNIKKANTLVKASKDYIDTAMTLAEDSIKNQTNCQIYRQDYIAVSNEIIDLYNQVWDLYNDIYDEVIQGYECCKGSHEWYRYCDCERYLSESQSYKELANKDRDKLLNAKQACDTAFFNAVSLEDREIESWNNMLVYAKSIIDIESTGFNKIKNELIPKLEEAIKCIMAQN